MSHDSDAAGHRAWRPPVPRSVSPVLPEPGVTGRGTATQHFARPRDTSRAAQGLGDLCDVSDVCGDLVDSAEGE